MFDFQISLGYQRVLIHSHMWVNMNHPEKLADEHPNDSSGHGSGNSQGFLGRLTPPCHGVTLPLLPMFLCQAFYVIQEGEVRTGAVAKHRFVERSAGAGD